MKKTLAKMLTFLTVMVVAIPLAFAMTVESAKQQGIVGERTDGLLGIVSGGGGDVQTLVNTTNAERLAKYKGIAEKRGTPLDQVQAVAGKKLIEKAAPGEFIQTGSGGWQKK